MNFARLVILLVSTNLCALLYAQEWVTILVHGSVGLGANFTGRTLTLIKRDCIEGSTYERNVKTLRLHPYINALQPLGAYGLNRVRYDDPAINGAAIFSELYTAMAATCGITENNTFYTFGWSGLISEKERMRASCTFYTELKHLVKELKKRGSLPKLRIIAYSHGGTVVSHCARLCASDTSEDSFDIDETILIGVPISKKLFHAYSSKPFKKVYNLYSRADKVQRLDIFTSTHFLSERTFKPQFPQLTQIELRYTAPLRPLPNQILPSGMRGIINQAPGHVEWWSFGWANSMYRKNLDMYPLSGSVFIPYLIKASQGFMGSHIQIDIRPEKEHALIISHCDSTASCIPFLTHCSYQALINKAFSLHPYFSSKRDEFIELEQSLELKPYQYAS